MRQKFIFVLVGIALLVGLITLPPAPVAEAGSNGQQLRFFAPSGTPKITWLYIHGTYYDNSTKTWTKTLNPAVTGYDLANYWWKKNVDLSWRLTNGVTGYCTVQVPVTMQGNWVTIDVSRNGGRTCYPS